LIAVLDSDAPRRLGVTDKPMKISKRYMTSFLGSSMNMSGLNATTMNALIQKLSASSDQL
jgi:hypothetical protein